MSARAALAYIDLHSALCIADASSLAFCTTCHILQPCLNGLVVALTTLLPSVFVSHLTVEDHYKLIASQPSLMPVLLAVAAIQSERFRQELDIDSVGQEDAAYRRHVRGRRVLA